MKKECQGCKQLLDSSSFNHSNLIDIMNALIEAGAERNIFTAAALGEVDRLRDLFSADPTLANKTTNCAYEKDITALQFACRSDLGKANQAYADQQSSEQGGWWITAPR